MPFKRMVCAEFSSGMSISELTDGKPFPAPDHTVVEVSPTNEMVNYYSVNVMVNYYSVNVSKQAIVKIVKHKLSETYLGSSA